jgi:sec-independent protein translocase protein TatB
MLPEVGGFELLVIAAIALIVVGPKDLPVLMRRVGQFLARMRSMAMEFRASFDEMARQSELDELRKEVEAMRAAAHQPLHTAAEAAGLHDIETELKSGLVEDPMHTYQPDPALPEVEAVAAPKPKRKRAKRAKAVEDAPGDAAEDTPAPEAQP